MIEGSWKGMKKYLEQEMLCTMLQGRVTYDLTHFKPGDSSAIFTVCIDRKLTKQFGFEFATKALREKGFNIQYAWDIPFSARDEYMDDEFSEALEIYRNQPISESIYSENPIVRMFAIVDRRVGKRTLIKLRDTVGIQPEWLRPFYEIRFASEGIHNPA